MDTIERSNPDPVRTWQASTSRSAVGSSPPEQGESFLESQLLWLVVVAVGLLLFGFFYIVLAPTTLRSVSRSISTSSSIPADTTHSVAPDLSADEIMSRCVAAYAECRSYIDMGVQRSHSFTTSGVTFATYFERGRGFRFEFLRDREHPPMDGVPDEDRMVIWGSEEQVRTWWSLTGNRVESMPLAVGTGGACGITRRASTTIPDLLMPGSATRLGFLPLGQPTKTGVEPVGTRSCFVLFQASAAGERTVWIDTQSFLVRRIRHRTDVGTASQVETEIEYSPAMNVAIRGADFEFVPPN